MKKKYKLQDLFKTSWEELSSTSEFTRMLELGEMLSKAEHGSKAYGLVSIEIMKTLRKQPRIVAKISLEQFVDCFNSITFFSRDAQGSFRTPWYFFPVPDFHSEGRRFCRPQLLDGLPMFDRIFDQLVYADAAFSKFCVLNYQNSLPRKDDLASEMDSVVNQLIAVLYTAPSCFDPEQIEASAAIAGKKLSTQKRALILHTYANVRSFIIERCPNLFPKSQDDDEAANDTPTPVFTGPMWMNLRYDLAKTEVFKGLETARRSRIYEALDFLDKEALSIQQRTRKE